MILDNLKLDGKNAIITGASRGLGRAMALAFAECGADLTVAARTRGQLEEVAESVRKLGCKCLVVAADVTSSAQVDTMVTVSAGEYGRIDILVNNAGGPDISMGKTIEEVTDEEWREGIDVNLTSQFYCCRAVIGQMVRQNRGKIVNVASGLGLRGDRHNYMYTCAKGGVIQLTRTLALSYARNNIQTNCIVPGIFPHTEALMRYFKGGKFIPIGRVGQDAEVGPLAVFLASDAANHINGELIAIDGGGLAGGVAPTGMAPRSESQHPNAS